LPGVDICPPGFHGAIACSSSTDIATLKISGDKMPPYEQCRVMRSAGLLALVTAMLALEHCA
jgi:hypothetical protein